MNSLMISEISPPNSELTADASPVETNVLTYAALTNAAPTQLFTAVIAVSVFFMAAWELMILNDRLNPSPAGLSLRGYLLVAYGLHIACISLAAVCLGWRGLTKVILGNITRAVIVAFALSVIVSGLLIVALADLTPPVSRDDLYDEQLEFDPSTNIEYLAG